MNKDDTLNNVINFLKEQYHEAKLDPDNSGFLGYIETILKTIDESSESDLEDLKDLIYHLPDESQDPVLIILKGHLLIEKLVRKFVTTNLHNPDVLLNKSLQTSHYITFAEGMCVPNKTTQLFWGRVRKLNRLRNKLAHNLDTSQFDKELKDFVDTTFTPKEGTYKQKLPLAIVDLFGHLQTLCTKAYNAKRTA